MGDRNASISLRCNHCAGPLSKDMITSDWNVPAFVRDSFSMGLPLRAISKELYFLIKKKLKTEIGSAVGGVASAFYGFNHVMPGVQKWIKGPMWVHFLIGAPPVIIFSSACAGLAGGAVPAVAQLAASSYHAAVTSPSLPTPDKKIQKSASSSTV